MPIIFKGLGNSEDILKARIRDIEDKLNLLLKHLEIDFEDVGRQPTYKLKVKKEHIL
jgi:hypothetical protein